MSSSTRFFGRSLLSAVALAQRSFGFLRGQGDQNPTGSAVLCLSFSVGGESLLGSTIRASGIQEENTGAEKSCRPCRLDGTPGRMPKDARIVSLVGSCT